MVQVATIVGIEVIQEGLAKVEACHATKLARVTTKADKGKDKNQLCPSTSRVSFSKTTKMRRTFKMATQTPALKELVHSPSS